MQKKLMLGILLVLEGKRKHFDGFEVILSTNYTYGLNLMKDKDPHVNTTTTKDEAKE